ncbi:MAG: FmdB family zinc ribbon protein [Anaerolineae bacterium]|nr:zinc ribbon domain-containing protein [Chloroflexota bacterium]
MPTYQYKCETCGVRFERFQHFSEDPIAKCPECAGPVHRVIQPVGVIFKGSGFYVTDNKKNTALPSKVESKESGASEPAESKAPAAKTASNDQPSAKAPAAESK